MPSSELTILSGLGRLRKRSRKSKRRTLFSGRRPLIYSLGKSTREKRRTKKSKKVARRSGMYGLGMFDGGKRCKGVNLALQYGVRRGGCKKTGKRTVCRTKAGHAYVFKDTKQRKHFANGHFMPVGGFGSLLNNFTGGIGMRRKTKRRSKGRRLASLLRVRKGTCKRAGRKRKGRTICRTRTGKGYIRRDTKGRKHTSRGRYSLRGIGGLGGISPLGFGRIGGSSLSGYKRRSRRMKSYGRRRSYRLGSLSSANLGTLGLPSIPKIFPPVNKDTLIRTGTMIAGAVVPMTVQGMVIPKNWRFGWKGLLSYSLLGSGIIMGANKFMPRRASDISNGVVMGLVFQIIQNYITKKPLIPAVPTRPVAAPLKGLGDVSDLGCASCANAGACGDIGDCIGYIDEDEDSIDGLSGRPRRPRRRPSRVAVTSRRRAAASYLANRSDDDESDEAGDYLMLDDDYDYLEDE